MLPKLVPPLDNRYVLAFFYHENGKKYYKKPSLLRNKLYPDEWVIEDVLPYLRQIATENRETIENVVKQHRREESYEKRDFHTSETKVIDNAIIGFVLRERLGK
ncbi:MAG: hypothetical protein ABIM21_04970 [candidate division WOR-3 bacterium]